MSGRIAVLLADRSKTATKVQKKKKTPVFSGSWFTSGRRVFSLEKYTFLCWLLSFTKKLDEAQDPDVMGNETGSAKIFFAATQALPIFFWPVPVPSGKKYGAINSRPGKFFAGDFWSGQNVTARPLLPGKFRCDSRLGPGNFLIAGMNAPDRSGRALFGLARPLSYRLRVWGGARAGTG
jgi:hypothetical protein